MKKLQGKFKFGWKEAVIAAVGVSIIIAGLMYAILRRVNTWFDTHTIQFNRIVSVEFKKPVEIKDREIPQAEIVKIVEQIPEYAELTDVEKYICDKWGVYDCKTAIAVARAESGLREDAVNVYNTNGTYDVGIFQVNSIHQSKEGCSLKELVDAKSNIDCAYKIYEASGWNAWSAFKSGAFKDKLE